MIRALDQAVVTAQSRIRAVSDFIDTRRGSIGPEARTRLAEAIRQLEAAQAKRGDRPERGPRTRQRRVDAGRTGADAGQRRRPRRAADLHLTPSGGGGSDLGAVIGGIIIGNVLRGGFGGGFGTSGWNGGYGGGRGMGRSTSFGGSSRSSGRSYSGGGGRF